MQNFHRDDFFAFIPYSEYCASSIVWGWWSILAKLFDPLKWSVCNIWGNHENHESYRNGHSFDRYKGIHCLKRVYISPMFLSNFMSCIISIVVSDTKTKQLHFLVAQQIYCHLIDINSPISVPVSEKEEAIFNPNCRNISLLNLIRDKCDCPTDGEWHPFVTYQQPACYFVWFTSSFDCHFSSLPGWSINVLPSCLPDWLTGLLAGWLTDSFIEEKDVERLTKMLQTQQNSNGPRNRVQN